ncbi:hypothetical protein KFL_008950040 [Klebsormidium nitens]|uniref:Uncharacterized protein n=1 Tax=Klebsormidium nitens TaxID=105231 RepID=A0A1Y1IT48_KLENI|nr:hypothetical protein KFL_008950040 [Klebsormidium nitens]|eukprot:GAQ91976.1 hypothetical protein KFL_008950040 [Klebsormidium nitens]
MNVNAESVEDRLRSSLEAEQLTVIDTSGGCGASFDVAIVSKQFDGKTRIQRHRLVNAALAEELKSIHALSIKKALTPQEWSDQQK